MLRSISPGLKQMAVAAFCFSLMTLCAKLVGNRIPSTQIVLVRTVMTLGFTLVLLRRARLAPFGTHRKLLFVRGLAGFLALDCLFYALPRLPLAEATLLQYLNPVLVSLLAAAFLGERLTRGAGVSLLLCAAGVLLVAKPGFLFGSSLGGLDETAVGIAILGAFLSSIAYIVIRRIGPREHPLVIVFYLPLVSAPAALYLSLLDWVWPTRLEWGLLIAIGFLTQVAQIALTKSLTQEAAGRATTVGYLQILFAATWGALFFGDLPDLYAFGGAALILLGVLVLTRKPQLPTPASTRR